MTTSHTRTCRGVPLRAVVVALALRVVDAAAPAQAPSRTELSQRINLARLVDLAAQQSHVHVDYVPAELESITVAVRLAEGASPAELWGLANQLLSQNGLTTVRVAGSPTLSVVKLADAAGMARLEDAVETAGAGPVEPRAGFESRLVEVRNRPGKDMLEAIKTVLGKPGGVATGVGDGRQIVVSDLQPRVEQAIWLARQLDVPGDPPVIERIGTRFLSATQLAAVVASAVESQKGLTTKAIRGSIKVAAAGDDETLLLVAPPDEIAFLKGLVEQFDRRAELRTASYTPRGFDLDEVSTLLEQGVRDAGPRGSGERWRIVKDTITGSLIVTATPGEHEQVRAAMERLSQLPPQARLPVRSFPILNRSVEEIVQLLQELVSAGVLSAEAASAPEASFDAAAASQQTFRDVLPPGTVSLTGASGPNGPNATSFNASASASTANGGAPGASPRDAQRGAGGRSGVGGAGGVRIAGLAALSITADKATNTLIASGEPRMLAQLESLLRTLDVRQPQVMLEVLVLSLTDSDTLDLGVELESLIQSGDTFIRLASLFGLGPIPLVPPVGGAIPAPAGQGGTALVLRPGDYGVLVRALETLNEGRTLNVPKILVNNNEQGTLDSTLQVPFLSTNASTTVATTSYGGAESAGTTVTIKPQIAAGDHMRLQYAVAISSFVGESSDPSLPPPKQENHLQSVVTIPDGSTIAVGGLEITTQGEAVSQVPFIGDVPGVGELFKKRSRSTSRTRFYVFITPQVLRRENFEDLRHLGGVELRGAGLPDGFPEVRPQVMR